jgi:small GTP-binding protein
MSFDYVFKIVIIGDSGVGKSSILQRYCNDMFNPGQTKTIGMDLGTKIVKSDDKIVKLHIWDTSGQENYRSLTENYYRDAHGVIVVFDMVGPATGYNVEQWIYRATQKIPKNANLIILGNKSDMAKNARRYSFSKPYSAVSAKTGHNIDTVFKSLIKDMITTLNPPMVTIPLSPISITLSEDREERNCCFR